VFLSLGSGELVSARRVVAMVRDGNRTYVHLDDMSALASNLLPASILARSRALLGLEGSSSGKDTTKEANMEKKERME
jgi:hypothetical protein